MRRIVDWLKCATYSPNIFIAIESKYSLLSNLLFVRACEKTACGAQAAQVYRTGADLPDDQVYHRIQFSEGPQVLQSIASVGRENQVHPSGTR